MQEQLVVLERPLLLLLPLSEREERGSVEEPNYHLNLLTSRFVSESYYEFGCILYPRVDRMLT